MNFIRKLATLAVALVIGSAAALGQNGSGNVPVRPMSWQPIGARTVDLDLAGPAGGAVSDAFFSADGSRLFAVTSRSEVWATADLGETWSRLGFRPEVWRQLARRNETAEVESVPPGDPPFAVFRHPYDSRVVFALGTNLYRSTDQGRTWVNLTSDAAGSVIGSGQKAIAFSPLDPNLIVVANSRGLWRSVDGGLSWSDLNRNLPNLPQTKIARFSDGETPRVYLQGVGPVEWSSAAWRQRRDDQVDTWLRLLAALPETDQRRSSPWPLELPKGWAATYRIWRLGQPVSPDLTSCASGNCPDPERHYISAMTAGSDAQPHFYAGTSDGHLWVSNDGGLNWSPAEQGFTANANPVTGIFVDPRNSRIAVAVLGGKGSGHVFRTTNGGLFWDDISANLPDVPVNALAANTETGSVYVAAESGLFHTRSDLRNPAPATTWSRLGGNLPDAAVEDVRLDSITGAVYVAVHGYGVYRTTVPDVLDALRVLNAADLTARAAAPGGLLTVIGAAVRAASTNSLTAPVLASTQRESQIQVPFEVTGTTLNLAVETSRGSTRLGLPLEAVSPAIFVDADGTPLVLDAAGGVLLDAQRPVRAGDQILILATGLGRVHPDWPTGLPAPLEDPPATVAQVSVFLNGAPLRVHSSTLAGGYIGVYMVRAELPAIVNGGAGDLVISAGDKTSNKVRIFVDPGQ